MNSRHTSALTLLTACAFWSTTVQGETAKIPFTATEWATIQSVETGFTDGTTLFITGITSSTVDLASDSRVSGNGTAVTAGAVLDLATMTGQLWGRIHIENPRGQWDGYWQATRTLEDGHTLLLITGTAAGSGDYDGFAAYWSWKAVDPDLGNPSVGTGYIVPAKNAPGDRPLRVSGLRTDQLQMIPGVFLKPFTTEVIGTGAMGRVDILSGVGNSSHLGRYTEQGLGIFDPRTGAITAMGSDSGMRGEQVLWIAEGTTELSPDGKTAVFNGGVNLAGGTGAFETATGGFPLAIEEHMESTDDGMTATAKYSYGAQGKIRYFPSLAPKAK